MNNYTKTTDNAELMDALRQDIELHYTEALNIMNSEDHKKQIQEFHDVVNLALKNVENIRRQALLYVIDCTENFYNKGFVDGIAYWQGLTDAIEENDNKKTAQAIAVPEQYVENLYHSNYSILAGKNQ